MNEIDSRLSDGIHFDVPFEEYLLLPYMSQSTLKEGRRSMAHLLAAMDGDRVKVPTDDMVLGSALHTCFLEPDEAAKRIVVWTKGRRYGNLWKAFKAEHAGKVIITDNQQEQLSGMIASLRLHPEVARWVSGIQGVEVSAIGMVNGLRMRGRCDALTADPLIDLKKVSDGATYKMLRTINEFGYDIQGSIYCRLFERERFMLICVEDAPPYDVIPYELSAARLRKGRREADELIERVLECKASGVWPGRATAPIMLDLQEWETKNDIIFGE